MRIQCLISWLLLAAICCASCKRIELQRATSSVYLHIITDPEPALPEPEGLDFESSPDLYARAYQPNIGVYRICLYDLETHQLADEDFLPAEGGFLNVASGIYDMVVYSAGSSVTIMSNEQGRSRAYAYTNSEQGEDGLMIPEPEHMFVAAIPEMKIPIYSAKEEIKTVEVKTSRITETYYLEFKNVVGLERAAKVEVRVSGQVPGRYIWDNRAEDLTGSVYFVPMLDIDAGRVYALFNTFGRNDYRYTDVNVILAVTDRNGRSFRWKVDVTDRFDDPDNTRNEILIDSEIYIPDTDDGDGMVPDVEDWDDEITHVPIL